MATRTTEAVEVEALENVEPSGPLCPHCYRFACPWLTARRVETLWRRGRARKPTAPDICPFFGQVLPPAVQRRLLQRINGEKNDA